jgi:L-aminopeptidase/D-esterase-like protein
MRVLEAEDDAMKAEGGVGAGSGLTAVEVRRTNGAGLFAEERRAKHLEI